VPKARFDIGRVSAYDKVSAWSAEVDDDGTESKQAREAMINDLDSKGFPNRNWQAWPGLN
jgi:hypothetical protein